MDFQDSPEEATFRAEARAWLADRAAPRSEDVAGPAAIFEHRSDAEEREWVAQCRRWQAQKCAAGYAKITWPKALGGRGGTLMEEFIFEQEESTFAVATGAFGITLGMIAPTVLAHGTEAQHEHLPEMLGGRELWCQLFSEPGAGSDLASLRTRAERDGDEWVISGQKVWTSGAHYADWGYILARSDPQVAKHRGLTAFLLPMSSPGVTIRPLRQMTGGANFNEVFLDGVRVGDERRLGGVGEGWRVAITTLMNERFSAGSMSGGERSVQALMALVDQLGRRDDPVVRQRLARIYCSARAAKYTGYRALTALSRGHDPGPEGSLAKLAATADLRAVCDLALAVLGPTGMLDGEWVQLALGAPGMRLGGGTDEIQRNIIAERVLGLPSEPRTDRDRAFAELLGSNS